MKLTKIIATVALGMGLLGGASLAIAGYNPNQGNNNQTEDNSTGPKEETKDSRLKIFGPLEMELKTHQERPTSITSEEYRDLLKSSEEYCGLSDNELNSLDLNKDQCYILFDHLNKVNSAIKVIKMTGFAYRNDLFECDNHEVYGNNIISLVSVIQEEEKVMQEIPEIVATTLYKKAHIRIQKVFDQLGDTRKEYLERCSESGEIK